MKTNKKLQQAKLYQITNKENSLHDFVKSMLNRTLSMFEWSNLPDTIPRYVLERTLQLNGFAVILKYKNSLYVTTGSLNGQEKSPYNEPTRVQVTIPQLNLNQNLEINNNCVVIKNDDLMTGLLPTLEKHGTLLVENEITMLLNNFNDRIQTLISGGTDQTIQSANKYLDNIVNGNLTTVAESSFLNDLTVHNAQAQGKITFDDLISFHQYIKSDLLAELGINTNENMKKERLITSEIDNSNEQTYPFIDNMLLNRKEGIKMVNKLFNGNIAVDFANSWKDKADKRNTPTSSNQEIKKVKPTETVDNPEPEQKPENKETIETIQKEEKDEKKEDK